MSWAPPCIITTNSLFRLSVSLSSMWWSHQYRLLFFPRSYSCHTFRNKDLMYSTDIECARGCENRKNDVIRRRMPIQNVKRSGIVCCYARHSYSVLNQLPTRPHGKVLIPRERATSQINPVPVPIGFRDLLRKRFFCISFHFQPQP